MDLSAARADIGVFHDARRAPQLGRRLGNLHLAGLGDIVPLSAMGANGHAGRFFPVLVGPRQLLDPVHSVHHQAFPSERALAECAPGAFLALDLEIALLGGQRGPVDIRFAINRYLYWIQRLHFFIPYVDS